MNKLRQETEPERARLTDYNNDNNIIIIDNTGACMYELTGRFKHFNCSL